MNRIRMTVLAVALLPLGALAAPPKAEKESAREAEKQARIARLVGLAEELELDEAQALKMAETLRKYDERRRPLREQVREAAEILERAAEGDSAALSQVEQAAQRAFDARAQLAALDRDMFQALSKDLPPQKRAKLALFMARFEHKAGRFKHRLREDRLERLEKMKMRRMPSLENRG
jgi:hypothetical protein